MGRLGITYQQVADAASKISMAGINPTIERIRRELGDTGSYSNIAKHFREWKTQHFNGNGSNSTHNTRSFEMPDAIQKVVGQIWEQMRNETAEKNEQHKQEMEFLLDNERKEKTELLQKVADLEKQLSHSLLEIGRMQTAHEMQCSIFKQQIEKSMREAIEYRELLERQRLKFNTDLDRYRASKEKTENRLIKAQLELQLCLENLSTRSGTA